MAFPNKILDRISEKTGIVEHKTVSSVNGTKETAAKYDVILIPEANV